MSRRLVTLAIAGILVCCCPARADIVTEWNQAAMQYINDNGISNQHGSRLMAMVHVAMYDAINACSQTHEPFLYARRVPAGTSREAAAATAALYVLSLSYPAGSAQFGSLYSQQMQNLPRDMSVMRGVALGRTVAKAVYLWRKGDGSAEANIDWPNGTEVGEYRAMPGQRALLPGWGQVKPFGMLRSDQFRLPGPPPLDSYEYARDLNEVKQIGSKTSSTRTAEQEAIAKFWPTGIPGIWNKVALQIAQQKGNSLEQNARLLALLHVTMADASVTGWNNKYHYNFWRPMHAIRLAGQDGNDATTADPAWEPLLMSPPFPEYVSGHSMTCASAATVLAAWLGSDEWTFEVTSVANPQLPPRQFTSLWAAAREAGISRIYGGIHFNFSNTEALIAGKALGAYIADHHFKPLDH